MNTSWEVEIQFREVTEQAPWLKNGTPSTGCFSDFLDSDWFWFWGWGQWLQSALQTLGMILFIITIVVSLLCSIFSKALNACLQLLTTKQMISLRMAHRKRCKENDQLKECETEVVNTPQI